MHEKDRLNAIIKKKNLELEHEVKMVEIKLETRADFIPSDSPIFAHEVEKHKRFTAK